MWLVSSAPPALIAFTSLYGFCSGVFIAVLPVIVAQISPDEKLGGRIGAFYSFLAIAQLVGSPIAGALIQQKQEGSEVGKEEYRGLVVFAVSGVRVGVVMVRLTLYRGLRCSWAVRSYFWRDGCMIGI